MKQAANAQALVFEYLLMRLQLSVPQVARRFGIPASTAVGIFSRLVERGLAVRTEAVAGKRGRPMMMYQLRLPKPLAVCHIDGTELAAAVFHENLDLAAMHTIALGKIDSLETAAGLTAEVLNQLLRKTGIDRTQLGGLAVSLNAVMMDHGQTLASSVLTWVNRDMEARFSQLLGLPVRRVRPMGPLAAYHALPDPAPRSLVEFQVADGISAHIIMHDQLVDGAAGMAGELGHVVVDPEGPLCGCGQRGCLEALAAGPAVVRHMIADLAEGVGSQLDRQRLADNGPRAAIVDIFNAWQAGDTYVRTTMNRVLDRLGWALGLLMNLVDPEMVVFNGYVLRDHPDWVERVIESSKAWTLHAAHRHTRFIQCQTKRDDLLRASGCYFYYADRFAVNPSASGASA